MRRRVAVLDRGIEHPDSPSLGVGRHPSDSRSGETADPSFRLVRPRSESRYERVRRRLGLSYFSSGTLRVARLRSTKPWRVRRVCTDWRVQRPRPPSGRRRGHRALAYLRAPGAQVDEGARDEVAAAATDLRLRDAGVDWSSQPGARGIRLGGCPPSGLVVPRRYGTHRRFRTGGSRSDLPGARRSRIRRELDAGPHPSGRPCAGHGRLNRQYRHRSGGTGGIGFCIRPYLRRGTGPAPPRRS